MAALANMNKSELVRHADSLGIEIDPSSTKAAIKAAIVEAGDKSAVVPAAPTTPASGTFTQADADGEFAVLRITRLADGSELADTIDMNELAEQGMEAATTGQRAEREAETFISNVMLLAKHAADTAHAKDWKASDYVRTVITSLETRILDSVKAKGAKDTDFPVDSVTKKVKGLMKVYRSQVSTAVEDGIEIGKTYSVTVERKDRKTGSMVEKQEDVKADSPNTLRRIRNAAKDGKVKQLENLTETTGTPSGMSDAMAGELNAIKTLLAKIHAGTDDHEKALKLLRQTKGAIEALASVS